MALITELESIHDQHNKKDSTITYKFRFLPDAIPKCFGDKQLRADFRKWGLDEDMVIMVWADS